MARKYHQGTFKPKNPNKYKGTLPITYRSSWELKLMIRLDQEPSFLYWNSESLVIPYVSPLDNRVHRYFVDFMVRYKTRTGEEKTMVIEIKPHSQTIEPILTENKKHKAFLTEIQTYIVNKAKWDAATLYCNERSIEFRVLNEYDLGIKKRKDNNVKASRRITKKS